MGSLIPASEFFKAAARRECLSRHPHVAFVQINEAINRDSLDPKAYYQRGKIRLALEDPKGAYADFSAAVRLDHDHAPSYAERAKISLADSYISLARQDMAQVERLMPLSDIDHEVKGHYARKKERYTDARFHFYQALAIAYHYPRSSLDLDKVHDALHSVEFILCLQRRSERAIN